jgi:hypothetical protein
MSLQNLPHPRRLLSILTLHLGVVCFVVAASITSGAWGALLVYEPFNYTAGQPLLAQTNTSSGTTANGNSWLAAAATTPTQYINTTSGNLTAPPELLPPAGNSLGITYSGTNNGAANRLGLSPDATSGSNFTSGTIYYSFLLRIDDINTGISNSGVGGFFIGLNNTANAASGSNPTVAAARLHARIDPTDPAKYDLGIFTNRAAVATDPVWTSGMTVGETLFVVASYDIGTANQAHLWINPAGNTFGALSAPTPDITDTTSQGNPTIGSIIVRQTVTPKLSLDELRVGTTWADVTPVQIPEPSTIALLIVTVLGFVTRRFRQN